MPEQSNTNRLAKNTAFMYFRMLFLMVISLFTSRVILQQLGVEDYGIYNVVGSIVVMFQSLKAIFASSTQRFLNYEMGRGNNDNLQLIYKTSTVVNALIAILFVLLVEVVGVWFLNCKINVDPSRLVAAKWVFQFSVITTVVGFMTTPLNACIIAHERMDFYAYLSIVEGLMKLGICYLVSITSIDKLVFYGLLVLLVAVIVYLANLWFCKKSFKECYLNSKWDSKLFKEMTAYAGWGFLGNTSFSLSQSGLNLVLNVFGGAVVNAARGIAMQVLTVLNGFVQNICVVVNPFAIKTFASGDINKTLEIVNLTTKLYFFIQQIIAIIFTFLSFEIIEIWLGQVPEYAVEFLKLVMIYSIVKSFHGPLNMLFSANGDIKYYQIIESIILLLPLPISYFLLKYGLSYNSVFVSVIICECLHIVAISLLAQKICGLKLRQYFSSAIAPCLLCIVFFFVMLIFNNHLSSIVLKMLNALITCLISCVIMYFVGLSSNERSRIGFIIKR